MSAIGEKIQQFKTFIDEVVVETKKTSWPERHELVESTSVVVLSVIILAGVVFASDTLLLWVLKMFIYRGRG